MRPYVSPGVYVEETTSAIRPIAGVGTSTAGFIGVRVKGIRAICGVQSGRGCNR